MSNQRIDQRTARVAGGWVDDQIFRFVDHDDRIVLVNDTEGDVFALRRRGLRRRQRNLHQISRFDGDRRIADRAFGDRDLSGEDQRLQPRARQVRKMRGQHAIEPHASFVGAYRDSFGSIISHGSSNVRRN
jgi:hypothetical protein